MKRPLILLMVLAFAVGSIVTAQAKMSRRHERTVEGTYGPYPAPITGCNEPLGQWSCVTVRARQTESFFTAKVNDAHGQPVFVEVKSGGKRVTTFCGETTEPIRIEPLSKLEFNVALERWPGDFDLKCPANRLKSTGTISVTLSNRP